MPRRRCGRRNDQARRTGRSQSSSGPKDGLRMCSSSNLKEGARAFSSSRKRARTPPWARRRKRARTPPWARRTRGARTPPWVRRTGHAHSSGPFSRPANHRVGAAVLPRTRLSSSFGEGRRWPPSSSSGKGACPCPAAEEDVRCPSPRAQEGALVRRRPCSDPRRLLISGSSSSVARPSP